MTLPLPSFYDPTDLERLYVERADPVARAALEFAREHDLRPARDDDERIAVLGIDCQLSFCHPQGSLYVPGASEDVRRATEWIYRHADRITALYLSLDTHYTHQVFHPAFWRDAQGDMPPAYTQITHDDVARGAWSPARGSDRDLALEYTKRLEEGRRYTLTVWPFHTMLGGTSHALVPALMEAAVFHAVARDERTRFEMKGRARHTEMYSILSPEVQTLGGARVGDFHERLYEELIGYDRVYVFGEAKSHCVLATLNDLAARIVDDDAKLTDKIWILEDAMSPVPSPEIDPLPPALDFARAADEGIAALERAGMHRTTTADALEEGE
jgi:nicotinamidase-related amidase